MFILSIKNLKNLSSKELDHIDIIELRADYLEDTSKDHITKIIEELKKHNKPILFSLFSQREGGKFPNDEKEIFQKLHWAIDSGCEYVSMEVHWSKDNQRKLLKAAKTQNSKLITTFHHSEKTYTKDGLRHTVRRCLYTKPDIVRLEFQAENMNDNLKIFELIDFVNRKYKTPLIAYAQGEKGILSHIIGESCGSYATFVSSESESEKEFLTLKKIQEIRESVSIHCP